MPDNEGSRPVPDPTLLTTQQLLREIALLREIVEARINAMDKALELVQRYPTEVQRAVDQLRDVLNEKFAANHMLIEERGRQVAVVAELQKEFRDKTESNLTKQLEGIQAQLVAIQRTFDGKLEDVKSRLAAVEGRM